MYEKLVDNRWTDHQAKNIDGRSMIKQRGRTAFGSEPERGDRAKSRRANGGQRMIMVPTRTMSYRDSKSPPP
jgi:hypothetical protein